ncbi:MAG: hypothetical protein R6U31_00230 [bacterium]
MKYTLLLFFIILLFAYGLTYYFMHEKRRRDARFYFLFLELIFFLSGYILSHFTDVSITGSYSNYFKFFALILTTVIGFTTALQFQYSHVKRIPPVFPIILTVKIIVLTMLFILFFIITGYFSAAMMPALIFFAGTSFTFVSFRHSRGMRKIIWLGILAPPIVLALYLILSIAHIVQDGFIFTFALLLICTTAVPYIMHLMDHLLDFDSVVIIMLSFLLIMIPFFANMSITPLLPAFFCGVVLTNINHKSANRFYKLFSKAEKPAFFLIMFIAGMHFTFSIRILLFASILVIIKLIVNFITGRLIDNSGIRGLLLSAVGGFELIAILSLFFVNIISSYMLSMFIVFLIISQIIQSGIIYGRLHN